MDISEPYVDDDGKFAVLISGNIIWNGDFEELRKFVYRLTE